MSMSDNQQVVVKASWLDGLKPNAKAFAGLVSVSTEGTLEFSSNDGSLTKLWPLEAFVRHRKHRKLPVVELKFNPEDYHSTTALRSVKFAEKVGVDGEESSHGPSDGIVIEKEAVFSFGGDTPVPSETNDKVIADFVAQMLEMRRLWIVRLEKEKEDIDRRTRRVQLEAYEGMLRKLVDKERAEKERKQACRQRQLDIARQQALENNMRLSLLYNELVIERRTLTAEEFWDQHTEDVNAFMPFPTANTNFFFAVDSALIQKSSPQKLEELFAPLLAESPFLRQRHEELLLSGQLSPVDFWSRLLNSRLYACMTGRKGFKELPKEHYFDLSPTTALPSAGECLHENTQDRLARPGLPAAEAVIQRLVAADLNIACDDALERPGFGVKQAAVSADQRQDRLFRNSRGRHATLLERLNRHAEKVLETRSQMAAYYTAAADTVAADKDGVEPPLVPGWNDIDFSEMGLDTLAELAMLEDTIGEARRQGMDAGGGAEGNGGPEAQSIEERIRAKNTAKLLRNLDFPDLRVSDRVGEGVAEGLAGKGGGGGTEEMSRSRRKLIVLGLERGKEIDAERQQEWLERSRRNFYAHPEPKTSDLASKSCFVKLTTSLKSSSLANAQVVQDALESPELVAAINEAADLQSKLRECLFHIYTTVDPEKRARVMKLLPTLKERVLQLSKTEIKASRTTAKVAAMINTRTLCQPIINAIDSCNALFASTSSHSTSHSTS